MFIASAFLVSMSFITHSETTFLADLEVTEATWIGGTVRVSSLTIYSDAAVYATDDLTIISDGPINIQGRLVGRDGDYLNRNAGMIRLISAGEIVISGELTVGRGAQGELPGESGGAGGDLHLEAPRILLGFDSVAAGDGASGGPGADGGNGGTIIVIGAIAQTDFGQVALYGGTPGIGGDGVNDFGFQFRRGGNGGHGGSAMQFHNRQDAVDWRIELPVVGSLLRDGPTGSPGADGAPVGPCERGNPGTSGGNAAGSSGAAGGNGANGYVLGGVCHAGETGGNGGKGW